MDYITAGDMAKKWGVLPRQVQKLLANGRIPGAVKYGRVWMIPQDAEKPADRRRGIRQPDNSAHTVDFDAAMPEALPFVRPVTKAELDAVLGFGRKLPMMPYDEVGTAYLRGDFELIRQRYREAGEDDELKLRLASVAVSAAVSLGDFFFYYQEIETFLRNTIQYAEDEHTVRAAEMCLISVYIFAHVPVLVPDWLRRGDFSRLSQGLRLGAAYVRTKYFFAIGDYTSMLAVAETTLSLCDLAQTYTHPGLYLKIACATACYSLGRTEDAEQWLLDGLHCGLHYGFITPFAESLPMFGGQIEKLLKKEYPGQFEAVFAQWERTFSNWGKFHNRLTGDNIALTLSLKEYEIAYLVTQGISSEEIAKRMHISLSRCKAIRGDVYTKLCIKSRKELKKLILSPSKNSAFFD